MANSDIDIVKRVLAGERKAYAVIVAKYEKPIFNAAFRIVGDYDEATDVAQAAFVKAYEKLDSYNPDYTFFNWIYRIAVNEAINNVNRRKKHHSIDFEPPSHHPDPEDDFQLSEISALLQQALGAVSYEHRIVIVLKHLLLLSYQEIGEILELPEKTVKSRLFTARQNLKKQLTKQGYAG